MPGRMQRHSALLTLAAAPLAEPDRPKQELATESARTQTATSLCEPFEPRKEQGNQVSVAYEFRGTRGKARCPLEART